MSNWNLEDELGFKIMRAARYIEKQLNESLYNFGLTLAQGKIILKLGKSDVVNQRTLSESLDVEPATIVRTLDRMERDGFIKRKKNPTDRRVHIIHLTDRARELVPSLEEAIHDAFAQVVGMVDKKSQDIMKEKLDVVNKEENQFFI